MDNLETWGTRLTTKTNKKQKIKTMSNMEPIIIIIIIIKQ
jgi:hypothetical protein